MMKLFYFLLISTNLLFAQLISDDFPNTASEALSVTLPINITGTSETDTDEDWFKFTLPQDDGVIITAHATGTKYLYSNEQLSIYTESKVLSSYPSSFEYSFFDNYLDKNLSLNLTAGTYYMKVINYWSDVGRTNDYNISIQISGTNISATPVLDATTVQYCKNHPLACGIDSNTTFQYTKEDINQTIQDTKNYCQTNPSLCGIATVSPLQQSDISSLANGWTLMGTQNKITDFSIFDTAKVIWYWDNGWRAYSPQSSLNETIQNSLTVSPLESIEKNRGFWIIK